MTAPTQPDPAPQLQPGELERLTLLLRHATGGAWAAALYNTAAIRDQVMDVLRARLAPLPIYDFTFNTDRTNPTAYLEQLPAEARDERAIVFLYDLTRGGERVWGYLEMQREALAEHPHGLVFWLTPGERAEAVRSAPNFWSQRSGVFDFTITDTGALAQMRGQWAGEPVYFSDRADWERQVRLYQGLLDEYEQSADAPVDTRLDLYGKLAKLHFAVSDYQRADELSRSQLTLAEESGNRRWYAVALNDIGLAHDNLGERRRALEYYEQALPIRREVGDRAGEAVTLNNIGLVYGNLGERQRALEYYKRALPIWREVGNRAGEATTLNNIGAVYVNLGEPQQALEYFEQALPIQREVGDRAGEARMLNNIGMVYNNLGEQQRALEYYEQALPIQREVGDRAGEAVTLNSIGAAYDSLGEQRQALGYYEQALPIRCEVGDRAGEAVTLNNIGLIYHNRGEWQRALGHYKQALPIRREVGDRTGEAVTLHNIGWLYLAEGDLDQARTYLTQALTLAKQVEYGQVVKAAQEGLARLHK